MSDKNEPHFKVSRRQFARLIGSSPDSVSRYIAEGMPVIATGIGRGHATWLDLSRALTWLLERKTSGFDQARTRLALAQAAAAEHLQQVRAKRVIPIEDVERIWSAEVAAIRAIILASYTTHADRIHRASTLEGLAGVERELKALAYEVLRELADPARAPMPANGASAR